MTKDQLLEIASQFEVFSFESTELTVDRVRQESGGFLWAVRNSAFCFHKPSKDFCYESMPSGRKENFKEEFRFKTLEEALNVALQIGEQYRKKVKEWEDDEMNNYINWKIDSEKITL